MKNKNAGFAQKRIALYAIDNTEIKSKLPLGFNVHFVWHRNVWVHFGGSE
jgi:hypothetical protein